MKYPFSKKKRLVMTLRFSILSICIPMFIIAITLIGLVSALYYSKSISHTANELMKAASSAVLVEFINQSSDRLPSLAQFVEQQKIRKNGFCFIISTSGSFLAYPDSVLAKRDLVMQSLQAFNQNKHVFFNFPFHGDNYFVRYEAIPSQMSDPWLIGVVIPESDFTNDLKTMYLTISIIGLSVLFLGVLLISRLISSIVKPIRALVKETEYIKHFDFHRTVAVNSQIKEILYLRDALRSMKTGLSLFQKFIPKILMKQWIESDKDIRVGGLRRKLAIFFSDIEGFTNITKKTDPNVFMLQLSEYFEALTQIIIQKKGTLDKYVGDSIMAFWGAPLPEPKACDHAASAAIYCQLKLNELNQQWKKEGKSPLLTRIGIHSGYAIVGNVGSQERLNYTAIGDPINIASRLEAINKHYKTKIIISEEVQKEISEHFVVRMIDCVSVEGRSSGSFIYELLGDDSFNISFDIMSYRPMFAYGFSTYQQQRWDEALFYFRQCLQIYPEDTIARIFITRCSHYKANPPGDTWDGIMRLL